MPLTKIISFKAVMQEGNRVQVPNLMRWQFRLEPTQVLEVTIRSAERIASDRETYYARMRKDGRLGIPRLIAELCKIKAGDIVEVRLSPVGAAEEEGEGD